MRSRSSGLVQDTWNAGCKLCVNNSQQEFADFGSRMHSISAAVGMLPPPLSPATSIAYINNANDDILSRCRKTLDCFTTLAFRVLALQQDPMNSLASSLRNTMDARGAAGSSTRAAEGAPLTPLDGVGAIFNEMDDAKIVNEPFDALQDMQIDMNDWSFPDFWAFDLGGDF